MKLKNYKLILTLVLLSIPIIVFAQVIGQSGLDVAAAGAGFVTDPQKTSVGTVVARVINGILSILGILFTYLIITAGFSWMTSGGNADKVLAAKTTLRNAFLGLFIVMISYALTTYIIHSLKVGTGLAPTQQEEDIMNTISNIHMPI